MFYNKYAHITNLTLLKSRKPRKGIVPQGPDLLNFITGNKDLLKLGNFGLEMMKFLPEFEQLAYAGKMNAEEGDEGAVYFEHGPDNDKTWVTQEWWDAFNEYELTDKNGDGNFDAADIDLWGYGEEQDGNGVVTRTALSDRNGDGRITNADTIIWEEDNGREDGYTEWRTNWISGQHHRTPVFGNFGSGDPNGCFAGSGMGGRFRNVNMVMSAGEWNHIMLKNDHSKDNQSALQDADQAYFVKDFLKAIKKEWIDVKNLLDNNVHLAGKSYYQIALDGSYNNLTASEAALYTAAMYESRERAWYAMSAMLGPVENTRNDQAMIDSVDDFIFSHNPYMNHHALSMFPLFIYMQHSFQNRVTTFYEKGYNNGHELSNMDRDIFWKQSKWFGRKDFNGDSNSEANMLYAYRDQYNSGSDEYNAVNSLINDWFGATEVENGRPIWENYQDEVSSWQWVNLDSATSDYIGSMPASGDGYGSWSKVVAVKMPTSSYKSYGWDRKWAKDYYVRLENGVEGNVWRRTHKLDRLHNSLYGHLSRMNENAAGWDEHHPEYTTAQFKGLTYNAIVQGPEFANNWAVHAVGMYLKWGEQMDIVRIMERCAAKRVISSRYKQDKTDYADQIEELQQEEIREKKQSLKRAAKSRKRRKAEEKKAAQRGKSSQGYVSKSDEKKAFQRALQKMRTRMYKKHTSNTKARLQKNKQKS
ncbi:MAG: hypothetical protein U9R38_02385 [Candidatus Margulisiibacteriota bacterium]|nr:hypothetical protein [Candidatus Margulisiibacteriota bacterium]